MRLQSCTTAVKHSYIAMYVVTNIICINSIRLNKAKHTKRPSDYATLTTSQRSPNTCIKQLKRERNRPRIDDSSIYVITRMSFRMVDSGHESGTNQADAASGHVKGECGKTGMRTVLAHITNYTHLVRLSKLGLVWVCAVSL